jgi:hypothetical protein
MGERDELPLATLDMELEDVPMPLVQVTGEFIEIFHISNYFLIYFCADMDASTHPSMPALTTGTTALDSNSSMGWNNTTWGQVDPPNWPSLTSSWEVDQNQGDRWASSTSPQMEYAHGLSWGQILSVCLS